MKKQTDLEETKSTTRELLYLDFQKTKFSPMIIKHPFTDSGLVYLPHDDSTQPKNILEDKATLERWQEFIKEKINECSSVIQVYMLISKPYKFAFIKYTEKSMSKDDLSEILADAWICSEEPNLDPNLNKRKLVSLFISSNPYMLMTEEKLEAFNSLDDEITIYRGVTSYNADNEKALSWTLDYDKAERFAKRFGEAGIVYEAQIEEAHILAYFNRKNESEIIVDPEYLLAIEETQTQIGEIAMM